jgi:NTP pyrophosphatase (non-canonical NTP hydrolase)
MVPQYNLIEIEELVLAWSKERGITTNGKVATQALKLVSEVGELCDNVGKGRSIKDDIGDCLVVLINIAKLSNLTLAECGSHAYNDIKDRKGHLNEHGNFIKEGDIDTDIPIKAISFQAVPNLIDTEYWFKVDDTTIRIEFTNLSVLTDIKAIIKTFSDGTKTLEQFKIFLSTIGKIQ